MSVNKHLLPAILMLPVLSACNQLNNNALSANEPVLSLTASTHQAELNSEFSLTWSASNVDSCNASGDWSGERATAASESLLASEIGSKTYTLTCVGDEGEVSASLEINIVDEEPIQGFNTMLMGHSFFRPIAEQLPFHATMAGVVDHEQVVEFSGGSTGAPMALWQDDEHRQNIQAVLDSGDIELFGMTYEGTHPTLDGYILWIDYALAQNPDTKFFIGLPWLDYPQNYSDATSYSAAWDYDGMWLSFMVSLRVYYPGVDIFSIPYGQAAVELRSRYEQGNLADITSLTGDADSALFTDKKGHGGNMLLDLAELIWLDAIYGIDLDTYAYDSGYQTDLKAIAKSIMDSHNPAYNMQTENN